MISTMFVKLAREVIKFISNGNKLTYSQFIYNYTDKTCCALGAIAFNHDRSTYGFVENYLGLTSGYDFYNGYDDFFVYGSLENPCFIDSDEYKLGYTFAKMCDNRGWVLKK